MHSGAKQVDKDLEDKISNTIDTGDEATDGKNSEQKATNDKTRDYVEANEKSSTKFACSMCDKIFKSKEGVKRHLEKFHKVTQDFGNLIDTDPIAVTKSLPVFKPPLLPATSSIDVSGPPKSKQLNMGEKIQKVVTIKGQTGAGKSKKRNKHKSNIGLCKSITNPFSIGGLKMEKFSIWDNKKKTAENKKLNNEGKPKIELPEKYENTEDNPNQTVTEKGEAALEPLEILNVGLLLSPSSEIQISVVPLQSAALPSYPNERLSRQRNKVKDENKKRARRCKTRGCGPCSETSDCGECRNCVIKSLK